MSDAPWDGQDRRDVGTDRRAAMLALGSAEANIAGFLAMIRVAEGTAKINGYRTLFGGGLFSNEYRDHPRVACRFTNREGRRLWTSAAGAYQFMAISAIPGTGNPPRYTKVDTWDRIKRKLLLPDFTPASQDRGALELINEAGALDDVREGRFGEAIHKCRGTWASLPGAGYAQPERTLASLRVAYIAAGGTVA